MSVDPVDVITRTLLYEGYWLYPYRRSSVKNQQRFNFGVLYPTGYASESTRLQMECPVAGDAESCVRVSVRFLQLADREATADGASPCQEAIEREVPLENVTLGSLRHSASRQRFAFPRLGAPASATGEDAAVHGDVEVMAEHVRDSAYKLTVQVSNTCSFHAPASSRDAALLRALVSAHVIVRVDRGAALVSLLDPPDRFRDIAGACSNRGVWPVLVGDEGSHNCMLASPIILYDYPKIAPESAGDLFDGTEIDEILALRILTLTEDEKREAREGDARVREILDRTDALPPEQWAKLHGAVRGLRKVTEAP